MNPANQYVARDSLKDAIRPQIPTAAVFVDLSRVSGAELRIKTLKVPAHFLPRLLETDRTVGLRDSASPVRCDQNVFVNFRQLDHPRFPFVIFEKKVALVGHPRNRIEPSTSGCSFAERRRCFGHGTPLRHGLPSGGLH
jgi:hypothetical protein